AAHLPGGRLVAGRRAADRRGHVGVSQPKPVVGAHRLRLARESRLPERAEEPVTAAVPGEDAPRAVAAMSGRREPDQEQTRARVAEAGQRARGVPLAAEAARRRLGHGLPVGDESRAAPTAHYLPAENPEPLPRS